MAGSPVELVWLHNIQEGEETKAVRCYPLGHSLAFHMFIYLLVENSQLDRAWNVTEEALRRNPLFVHARLERCEIHKLLGHTDELFEETRTCFQVSYMPKDIAKCYRNFGFVFAEK